MSEQPEELKSKRIDESVFEADARREIERLEEPLSGELIIAAKNFSTYGPLKSQDWFLYGWMVKRMDEYSRKHPVDDERAFNEELVGRGIRFDYYEDCVFIDKMQPDEARAQTVHEFDLKRTTIQEYDSIIREAVRVAANRVFKENHIPQHYVRHGSKIVLEALTTF